ncbi:MAG: hypothetical protein IT381_29675 [Deltaproteobacteria bacterium]|nr:hypothetical protein [Deltaproteobacteria bacterium]
MRIALLAAVSAALCFGACTPPTPAKAKENQKCNTNADCASGFCAQNRCLTQVNCADDANASSPLCQDIGCHTDKDCPSAHYYCDVPSAKCIFGAKPPCKSDDDCGEQHCLIQDGEDNTCVDCLNTKHCAAEEGTICDVDETYTCIKADEETGCTTNDNCAEDPDAVAEGRALCNPKTGKCVECMNRSDCPNPQTASCRANKCEGGTTQDCTMAGCPTMQAPFCDAALMPPACVGCDDPAAIADMFECPDDFKCDNMAASPTKGECVPDQPINPGNCAKNSDCPVPTFMIADATQWCDLGNANGPTCSPCRTTSPTDCGAGFTCTVDPNQGNICKKNTTAGCGTSAANCSGATDACVAGTCQATCQTTSQCRATQTCNPATHVCETPVACHDNTDCVANGVYTGQACKGAPAKCQDCAGPADCASSPNMALTCDNTTKHCIAPVAPSHKLGAPCQGNEDCESGQCLDLGLASPICTSICARTATSAASPNNDCPTTPDPALTLAGGRGPLPLLKANQGFRCVSGFSGSNVDGIGFCVHAVDVQGAFGATGISGVTGVYTKAAGTVESVSAQCQFGFRTTVTTTGGGSQSVCAAGCGTNADCSPGLTAGTTYTCNEVLVSIENQYIGSGLKTCFARGTTARQPGDFCNSAAQCRENFCAGSCIAHHVQRTPIRTCRTDDDCTTSDSDLCVGYKAATGGAAEVLGRCYRSTDREEACDTDADCSGNDQCWDGSCFAPESVTNRLCQDINGCADTALQFCAGRCAKHCNEQSDCAPDYDDTVVCAYLPAAPGYNQAGNPTYRDGFTGASWSRVCASPVPPADTFLFDHSLVRGEQCIDDTECISEVCVNDTCTDLCGRSQVCEAGEVCQLVERNVFPGDSTSTLLLMPVCVVP